MSPEAADWWARGVKDLESAARELPHNPDLAAACAYYAAFYALTALFALEGRTFKKHSAIRDAMHRDLVRSGRLPIDAGRNFDELMDLRAVGSYGGAAHVSHEEAADALAKARGFFQTIRSLRPEEFSEAPDAPSSQE